MCRRDIKYFQILFAYREFSILCLFRKSEVRTEAFIEIFDFNNYGDVYSKKKKKQLEEIYGQLFI